MGSLPLRVLRTPVVEFPFLSAILTYAGGVFPVWRSDPPEMAAGLFYHAVSGFYLVCRYQSWIIHASPSLLSLKCLDNVA